MKDQIFRYATPLITGLFLISLISGALLYFHLYGNYVRSMHELLSMVLILPFVLHLWRNWRAFLGYFKRAPFAISMVICVLAAGYFVITATANTRPAFSGGPPQFAFAHKMMANTPDKLAGLFGKAPDQLVEQLKLAGFSAAASDVSMSEIATKSGKDEGGIVALLMAR